MSKWDNNIIGCTGLMAGNLYGWQAGLRWTVAQGARIIGQRSTIFTPMNGYSGWEKDAESIIRRRPKRVWYFVHSNGGKRATFVANRCWEAGCPTEFVIIMFDRTLGYCEKLHSNVVAALDMHVNKSWLVPGPDFKGQLKRENFRGKTSHVGVINYKPAQSAALEFARIWK